MQSNSNLTQVKASSHTIPVDLILDVVRILLKCAIDWRVEGINEKENSLLIQVRIPVNDKRQHHGMDNILTMLEDYAYFTKGAADYKSNGIFDQMEHD